MECIYCNAELTHEDSYGSMEYIIYGTEPKSGDIYRCPNHEGFETLKEAQAYLDESGETVDSLGLESLSEVCCGSCCHNVSGSFYTDSNDNLREGYPC